MVLKLMKMYWWLGIIPTAVCIGSYFDRRETDRLSGWKNKTELYRRELKEGEDPWKAY